MFHVNTQALLIQAANSGEFSEDDEVWRGDDGSFLIGDTTAEFEEDEDMAVMYVLAGTLGEYATKKA